MSFVEKILLYHNLNFDHMLNHAECLIYAAGSRFIKAHFPTYSNNIFQIHSAVFQIRKTIPVMYDWHILERKVPNLLFSLGRH